MIIHWNRKVPDGITNLEHSITFVDAICAGLRHGEKAPANFDVGTSMFETLLISPWLVLPPMEDRVATAIRSFTLELRLMANDGNFYRCPVVVHHDKGMNPYRGDIRDKDDNQLAEVLMIE